MDGLMAYEQNRALHVRGRTQGFILFCFHLPPLDFAPSLEFFRTLNIKEFLKIHVNTFWVEKLTQDSPLFTNYEQEHAFLQCWLCEDCLPNPPFPFGLFHSLNE